MIKPPPRLWHIASVSFGKDSLAMLLGLIERKAPLDEVVFYDTGMEFQAIYDLRDEVLNLLECEGIQYTELTPDQPFLYNMMDRPVNGTKNGFHHGYSWCGGRCRWGTTEKLKAIDLYAEQKKAVVYVGIAADEYPRIEKKRKAYKRLPLVEWGMTEQDCFNLCYQYGFCWVEGTSGIELYDLLDRASCWCCANKNLKELKNIYIHLPEYWERLKDLQRRLDRPMKGYYKGKPKGIFELEERFRKEIEHDEKL